MAPDYSGDGFFLRLAYIPPVQGKARPIRRGSSASVSCLYPDQCRAFNGGAPAHVKKRPAVLTHPVNPLLSGYDGYSVRKKDDF
jgi:hypothetical protein